MISYLIAIYNCWSTVCSLFFDVNDSGIGWSEAEGVLRKTREREILWKTGWMVGKGERDAAETSIQNNVSSPSLLHYFQFVTPYKGCTPLEECSSTILLVAINKKFF